MAAEKGEGVVLEREDRQLAVIVKNPEFVISQQERSYAEPHFAAGRGDNVWQAARISGHQLSASCAGVLGLDGEEHAVMEDGRLLLSGWGEGRFPFAQERGLPAVLVTGHLQQS